MVEKPLKAARSLVQKRHQAPTHLGPIPYHLIPHGFDGAIALLLGALLFSTTLRPRYFAGADRCRP